MILQKKNLYDFNVKDTLKIGNHNRDANNYIAC